MSREPTQTDRVLLWEVLEFLDGIECRFWACDGPRFSPIAMRTCNRCDLVSRVRKQLHGHAERVGLDRLERE